jgi:hypothetical protein
MADPIKKPTNLEAVEDDPSTEPTPLTTEEQLDEDEAELRAIRLDLPGVKGASSAGIVAIAVDKVPSKNNEFFRTHPTFRPIVPLVHNQVGLEKQYFAVTRNMVEPIKSIGITMSDHVLYLTVTVKGTFRIVPVQQANANGDQNEYHRTKEIGLLRGIGEWVRLYHDKANSCYETFPAPADRFGDAQFPELKEAKIFRLSFRDKGRLIDSTEHLMFRIWTARDSN